MSCGRAGAESNQLALRKALSVYSVRALGRKAGKLDFRAGVSEDDYKPFVIFL